MTQQVELEGSSKLSVSWMQVLDNQQGNISVDYQDCHAGRLTSAKQIHPLEI